MEWRSRMPMAGDWKKQYSPPAAQSGQLTRESRADRFGADRCAFRWLVNANVMKDRWKREAERG